MATVLSENESIPDVILRWACAAFGDDEAGRLDAARLLNNLSGSSESAALAIGNRPSIMDAVKHLCCSGTFAVRLRALGIVVSLSRQHQLHNIIKESEIFEMAAAAAAHDKAATQEYALFCVAVRCSWPVPSSGFLELCSSRRRVESLFAYSCDP